MIAQIEARSSKFKQISPNVWSDEVDDDNNVDFVWCCHDRDTVTSKNLVTVGTAAVHYKTNTIISPLFSATGCFAYREHCTTSDLTAVWVLEEEDSCNVLEGAVGYGQKHGSYIMSDQLTLAVKLKDEGEVTLCDGKIKAVPTYEGIFVTYEITDTDSHDFDYLLQGDEDRMSGDRAIDEAMMRLGVNRATSRHAIHRPTPQEYYNWQRVVYEQTKGLRDIRGNEVATNMIGLISFVYMANRQLAINLFHASWSEICQIHSSRYFLFLNMQSTSPTAVARAILQRQDVVAKFA